MTQDDPQLLECGRTIDELSDYLEAGRMPYDADIETCPECLNALDALARAGQMSRELTAVEAEWMPPPAEGWFEGVMNAVRAELRAGRSIPLSHPDPAVRITLTEGAVHALIRSVGDGIPGVYVGRSDIVGEIEQPGAPVSVDMTVSVAWGSRMTDAAQTVRAAVTAALARHTELNVTAVDVTVQDLHRLPRTEDTAS